MTVLQFQTCWLSELSDQFALIADIGFEVAARDPAVTQRKLQRQAAAGMKAVVGRHEGEIKAFMSVGDARKSLDWTREIPLMMHLQKTGRWPLYAVDNVFVRKEFWKTGSQLALSRTAAAHILDEGCDWMLLYGYPSDEMNAYSMKQPGSIILDGFLDYNGRPVGVRNVAEYLTGTA
jgi:hypothetical protein